MSSQAFQSIIARLQQRQISADEAGQLLRRLKADSQDVAQEGRGERPAVCEGNAGVRIGRGISRPGRRRRF
uniref:hypothetical protein n=1 Tax=Pseudomonas sp. KCJK8993 TaxID=3344565 RepID=UPI003905B612